MKYSLLIFSFLFLIRANAQVKPLTINARVVGDDNKPLSNVMVINKRLGTGFIAEINGTFKTQALKTDTLLILCSGYVNTQLCLHDSAGREVYSIMIKVGRKVYKPKQPSVNPKPVKPKNAAPLPPYPLKDTLKKDPIDDYYNGDAVKLKTVTIYDIKKYEVIRKKIDSLGIRSTDDYKHYNVLESPITALYERFSKREQDKRKVAELENNDRKKEVLHDLLALYISYDIIELTDEEFDDFLDKLYVPDDILKNASDYQLGEFIKKQYLAFKDYLRYR